MDLSLFNKKKLYRFEKDPKAAEAQCQELVAESGNELKDVLVLTSLGAAKVQKGEEIEQLKKILAAAKLSDSQVSVLAYEQYNKVPLAKLLTTLKPKHCLVFGIEPQQLGLQASVQLYGPYNFYDTSLIFSKDLAYLMENVEHKKALWGSLQEVFLTKA